MKRSEVLKILIGCQGNNKATPLKYYVEKGGIKLKTIKKWCLIVSI